MVALTPSFVAILTLAIAGISSAAPVDRRDEDNVQWAVHAPRATTNAKPKSKPHPVISLPDTSKSGTKPNSSAAAHHKKLKHIPGQHHRDERAKAKPSKVASRRDKRTTKPSVTYVEDDSLLSIHVGPQGFVYKRPEPASKKVTYVRQPLISLRRRTPHRDWYGHGYGGDRDFDKDIDRDSGHYHVHEHVHNKRHSDGSWRDHDFDKDVDSNGHRHVHHHVHNKRDDHMHIHEHDHGDDHYDGGYFYDGGYYDNGRDHDHDHEHVHTHEHKRRDNHVHAHAHEHNDRGDWRDDDHEHVHAHEHKRDDHIHAHVHDHDRQADDEHEHVHVHEHERRQNDAANNTTSTDGVPGKLDLVSADTKTYVASLILSEVNNTNATTGDSQYVLSASNVTHTQFWLASASSSNCSTPTDMQEDEIPIMLSTKLFDRSSTALINYCAAYFRQSNSTESMTIEPCNKPTDRTHCFAYNTQSNVVRPFGRSTPSSSGSPSKRQTDQPQSSAAPSGNSVLLVFNPDAPDAQQQAADGSDLADAPTATLTVTTTVYPSSSSSTAMASVTAAVDMASMSMSAMSSAMPSSSMMMDPKASYTPTPSGSAGQTQMTMAPSE